MRMSNERIVRSSVTRSSTDGPLRFEDPDSARRPAFGGGAALRRRGARRVRIALPALLVLGIVSLVPNATPACGDGETSSAEPGAFFERAIAAADVSAEAIGPTFLGVAFRVRIDDDRWVDGELRKTVVDDERWRQQIVLPGYVEDRGRAGDVEWQYSNYDYRPYAAWMADDVVAWSRYLSGEPSRLSPRGRSRKPCTGFRGSDTTACFDRDTGKLERLIYRSRSTSFKAEFAGHVPYRGAHVPREVSLQHDGEPALEATVGLVELPESEREVEPPEGADVRKYCKRTPPERTHWVGPDFPDKARQLRKSGRVVLEVTVTKEGDVRDPHVLIGHPMFAEKAIAAVLQWKYVPAKCEGEAEEITMTVAVMFTMS